MMFGLGARGLADPQAAQSLRGAGWAPGRLQAQALAQA